MCRIGRQNESGKGQSQQLDEGFTKITAGAPPRWSPNGRPGGRREGKKPLSALEIGLHQLLQLGHGHGAALDLAVDEESRGGVDPKLLGGTRTHLFDAVE